MVFIFQEKCMPEFLKHTEVPGVGKEHRGRGVVSGLLYVRLNEKKNDVVGHKVCYLHSLQL